jgi:uncharacterized protein YjiS (DUF1127 family)
MNTSFDRNHPAAPVASFAILFHDSARALRKLAARVDAWLGARERSGQDREDLARMSERELADIGLYRGNLDIPFRPLRDDDVRW